MLDNNDKKWITDTIDEKLDEAKTELRGEMQEMKTELRGEMQEMKTELCNKIQEMSTDIVANVTEKISEEFLDSLRTQSMVVLENTYRDYMKIALPD